MHGTFLLQKNVINILIKTLTINFDINIMLITKQERRIKMDKNIELIKSIGFDEWKKKIRTPKRTLKYLMKKYATAYYEGSALISDNDFDVLVDGLKSIDKNDKYLTTPGWGYEIKNGKKHKYGKIDTLKYYFDYNLLKEEFENINDIIVTPKFDGLNYVAYYNKGKLVMCLTRGNGYEGKDITSIYEKNMMDLPENLKEETFAFNGEVIIRREKDNENNVELRDKIAKCINKGKCDIEDNENILFIPFMILNKKIDYLENIKIINSIKDINYFNKEYSQLPKEKDLIDIYNKLKSIYPIDGLVLTSKNKEKQIAFKFK